MDLKLINLFHSRLYPEGINLVLDCLAGDINKGFSLLKALGHYVLYGTSNNNGGGLIGSAKSWWQSDKIKPMKLFEEHNKTISGFNLRQFLYQQNGHEQVKETVNKVYKMYLEGKIKPTIDSRFAFEDVNEAMLRLHERKNIGKIILDVNLAPTPVEEPEPAAQPAKKKLSINPLKLIKKRESKETEKKEDEKEENKEEEIKDAEKVAAVENKETKVNGEEVKA